MTGSDGSLQAHRESQTRPRGGGAASIPKWVWVATGMAALFLIGFGSRGVAIVSGLAWLLISFPVVHFHAFWMLIKAVAIGAFVIIVGVKLADWETAFNKPRTISPVPPPEPFPGAEIENFRDQSAYGDANLATRAQIARALTGTPDGLTPKFED